MRFVYNSAVAYFLDHPVKKIVNSKNTT